MPQRFTTGRSLVSFLGNLATEVFSTITKGRSSFYDKCAPIVISSMCFVVFPVSLYNEVNLAKSSLIPAREVLNVRDFAYILVARWSLCLLLGLPLGSPFNETVVWDPIVDRFHKYLVGQKQYFSRVD